ncbi:histone deacetylase family protein [Hahella aquimaris]|uniref:histone deacetylase family protein n=1 Tax=Hahella sp. HNIBRBA332 TaxID=3015983 RepID=UPI00273C52A2|nr:histone deacetylase family protein [Hahella sp. HNIBRBA332]WLQ15026.1 histone deacetylase family protein [Hahella sp. HNIBRBA332]
MKTALFYHKDCTLHDMGEGHPESPMRLQAIMDRLEHAGILQEVDLVEPQETDRDKIIRVHPSRYVEQLENLNPDKGRIMVDPDTALMRHSMRAAYLAAGSAVEAADMVLSGQANTAFCAVRPPGHHAERSQSMGFCFFNNIAIAARHAMDFHGLERIAIVDFDVHQGNGTVDIFQDDPRVLFCSSFEYPLYPFSHHAVDRPNIINTPLDAHTRGLQFRRCVERDWLARLQDHRPQLILISAGFDAHKHDPLAHLELEERDYRWVTRLLMDVARVYSSGRIVSILEGGYNLNALSASVEAHMEGLMGN